MSKLNDLHIPWCLIKFISLYTCNEFIDLSYFSIPKKFLIKNKPECNDSALDNSPDNPNVTIHSHDGKQLAPRRFNYQTKFEKLSESAVAPSSSSTHNQNRKNLENMAETAATGEKTMIQKGPTALIQRISNDDMNVLSQYINYLSD